MDKKNCAYLGFIAGATLGLFSTIAINYLSKPTQLEILNRLPPYLIRIQDRKGKSTFFKLEKDILIQKQRGLENINDVNMLEPNKPKKQKNFLKYSDPFTKR